MAGGEAMVLPWLWYGNDLRSFPFFWTIFLRPALVKESQQRFFDGALRVLEHLVRDLIHSGALSVFQLAKGVVEFVFTEGAAHPSHFSVT